MATGNRQIRLWRNTDCLAAWLQGFEHERIHIETSSVLIREVRCIGLQRGALLKLKVKVFSMERF